MDSRGLCITTRISGLQRSTVALTFALYLEAKAAHAVGFGKAGLACCMWLFSRDPSTGDLITFNLGESLTLSHRSRHSQNAQKTTCLHCAYDNRYTLLNSRLTEKQPKRQWDHSIAWRTNTLLSKYEDTLQQSLHSERTARKQDLLNAAKMMDEAVERGGAKTAATLHTLLSTTNQELIHGS